MKGSASDGGATSVSAPPKLGSQVAAVGHEVRNSFVLDVDIGRRMIDPSRSVRGVVTDARPVPSRPVPSERFAGMTNLLNLYRTQVRILWNWRGGWWALTKRIIITLLVATVAFKDTAYILPGNAVVRVVDAVIAV